jgi:hypothetical protein
MRDEGWDAGSDSETENRVWRKEGCGIPHPSFDSSSLLTPFPVSLFSPVSQFLR